MLYDTSHLFRNIKRSIACNSADTRMCLGSIFDVVGQFTIFIDQTSRRKYIEYDVALRVAMSYISDKIFAQGAVDLTKKCRKRKVEWTELHVSDPHDIRLFFDQKKAEKREAHKKASGELGIKHLQQYGGVCLALDFEMFEFNQSEILEIGLTSFDASTGKVIESEHLIISDYLHRKNRKFVRSHRECFEFGTSKTVTLLEASEILAKALSKCEVLVTHGGRGSDDRALQELLPNAAYDNCLPVNTAHLTSLITGRKRLYKLVHLAETYGVDCTNVTLHNAGNDAYITALTTINMLNVLACRVDIKAA